MTSSLSLISSDDRHEIEISSDRLHESFLESFSRLVILS